MPSCTATVQVYYPLGSLTSFDSLDDNSEWVFKADPQNAQHHHQQQQQNLKGDPAGEGAGQAAVGVAQVATAAAAAAVVVVVVDGGIVRP